MSTTAVPDRFTTLPDEHALQATVVALEEHGFSVEVVSDLDAAPGGAGPHPGRLAGDDQHLGDAGRDRDRGRHQRWRRAVGVGAEQDVRAGLRDPGAGNEGDRRPARLRAGQRASPPAAPWWSPRPRAASWPRTRGARPT